MAVRSVTDLPTGAEGDPLDELPAVLRAARRTCASCGNTFWIAGLSTLACLVIGYPYAYLMRLATPRWAGLLLIAVLVPFWSSLLVRTYAWQVILRDTGLINSTLQGWGLIDEPLDLYQTTTGVLLGMTQILLPFMVLPLYTTMARIDPELTKAAANLGRVADPGVPARVPPALDPGRARRLAARVRPRARLLHHAGAAGLADATRCSARSSRRASSSSSTGASRARWPSSSSAVTLVVLFLASRVIRVRDVFGALDAE